MLEFHIKTPYDKFAKIHAKGYGHMTKMATMPTYGINHSKSSTLKPKGQLHIGFDM